MPSSTDIVIGFVGAGRMAQAIGRGIADQSRISKSPAHFIDPSDDAAVEFVRLHPGAVREQNLADLCSHSNCLMLAVKPQVMPGVLEQLAPVVRDHHVVVSIAAGITLATLDQALVTRRIVRVMPNTPCLIGQGISAISFADEVVAAERSDIQRLFQAIGETIVVPEYQLNAVTGLSGSGPAYVYTFIESLIDGGVLAGLPRPVARQLALQTVDGATAMIRETGKSAADLRAEVTSPGGTTISGLGVLERNGFRGIVMDAVRAATRRAEELSGS